MPAYAVPACIAANVAVAGTFPPQKVRGGLFKRLWLVAAGQKWVRVPYNSSPGQVRKAYVKQVADVVDSIR